ncbi:MAG: hypothetical protein ACREBG_19575 [Pyrinomonadaceae bacterium]
MKPGVGSPNYREWSPGELEFLRANYLKTEAGKIAVQLNRSRFSVYGAAKHLGLNGSKWSEVREFTCLTDAQKGWVAGIIDGEGWIGVDTRSCRITVQVNNTDPKMLGTLKLWCGGYIYPCKPRGDNCKPCWTWALSRRQTVINFLTTLLPLLVTKRTAAEKALAYVSSRKETI